MRALVFAVLALVPAVAPAHAHCLVGPGDAPWQGAGRATAQALCFQQELAQSTRTLADDMAWRIEFGTLAARTERLLMQQRAATFLHN